MKFLDVFRNYVETSEILGNVYARMGGFPPYRGFVDQKIRDRIQQVRADRTYEVMIEVSSACNARCSFCPQASMNRKKQIISEDTFNLALDRLRQDDIHPTLVDLFDVGEPLLDRNLFHKVRQVKSMFPGTKVSFTTNFELADDAIMDEILDSGLDSIHISLNAAKEETHTKIMRLDSRRTFANVERFAEKRLLKKADLPIIRLSMIRCPENEGEEMDFVRRWKNKVDNVFVQRPIDWGGGVNIDSQYAKWQRLYPCMDLFERIVILANGEIAICSADYEGQVNLSIQDHRILEIFYSEAFENIRQAHLAGDIQEIQLCRNCSGVHSNGMIWLIKSMSKRVYTV
jgi:uncharacterized radical SAM superfamily Fe-S cluster-containing enzyme